jgi:CheY-like chemotaxis protein
MPGMNGWQFMNEFEKLGKDVDVYIFSSSIDPDDVTRSKTYRQVKGFISKPLDKEKIRIITAAQLA